MSASPKALKTAFLEHYYRFATPEDIPETSASREALATSHLTWGMVRRRGQIMVRAFNPTVSSFGSSQTIIETVADDSPFIVDSLTMQLNAMSQGVHVKLHSVLNVERDDDGKLIACHEASPDAPSEAAQAESWTHFAIPRVIDRNGLRAIERQLTATLRDVRSAVRDWPRMKQRLLLAADSLGRFGRAEDTESSVRFLHWLADDHFTLLGYCNLRTDSKPLGLLKSEARRSALRSRAGKSKASKSESLTITKAPIRSTVHRPALLDDVRVDAYDGSGKVSGEHRFVGLFTSAAYSESPRDIPLLRARVKEVIRRSGLDPSSHRGKALAHILDTFPRDELIQSSARELERIGIGILNIEERRKIRLFVSESAYGDFYSCLVYLPRDGYNSRSRARIETLIEESLDGELVDSQLAISESTLARLSLTLQRHSGSRRRIDAESIERTLADVAMAWMDRARIALLRSFPEERAFDLHHRFANCFPVSYQETEHDSIARDFAAVASIADGKVPRHFEFYGSGANATFSIFLDEATLPLYLTNPILENMGVRLMEETGYELPVGDRTIRILKFNIESAYGEALDEPELADRFSECFAKTLSGEVENDAFNQLIVSAGLVWQEALVLRAYCKYLLQCRAQFSQAYMIDALRRHPTLVRGFIGLFAAYFDPEPADADRDRAIQELTASIREALNLANSLDDDRILRMFFAAIQATLRSNFYQRRTNGALKPYLSLKLDPTRIPEMPEPRPKFEIFVYSPSVEGVHLRSGSIARGGIRWSDRREDFRTEVLGLMKAQKVKNTVIVPTGAKGGFVLKQAPSDGRLLGEHALGCYRTFLRGLLDLTDNLVGKKTIAPKSTVCRDRPDPYLVVAADKGTATFSDTANAVAQEYGFWLGDAFASGGSSGYDHKRMGITARGAWESVKRHFRELGLDTHTQAFSVIGIGDMSGDVFGNGMLLSPQIRLIAAFNHKHIFVDPEPDPKTSFEERQRLFGMPRSAWTDYDRAILSKGGAIYDRSTKSIHLSPEARAALDIQETELTPLELIRCILKAPADLFWNGGIGTYVKATTESDSDAADPVNDPVRINGDELRVKVVAEGGNLGLTQRGRIEFALAGGRINTDFIDNSAGVDSSDREVNIKILLADAIRRKYLASTRRNSLLAAMTDEVASLVLASNYAQTQALSMMVTKTHERIGEHARLIRLLESRGILNRALEFLPGEDEIDERKRAGLGFTRPELAVILSYAKIELFESLIETDIPDENYCQSEVLAYFPERLRKRFPKSIETHRLKREIAAMLISSSMINRMGPSFVLRAENDTGGNAADVARAYAIVRGIFDTRALWRAIERCDGELEAQVQYECFFECSRMIRRAVYWFLHRRSENRNIETSIARKHKEVRVVMAELASLVCGWSRRSFETDVGNFEALGVAHGLAERIASLRLMTQALDIAELAREFEIAPLTVARLYFELGRGLRLDWIRDQIEALHVEGHWSAMARGTLRETLGREQRSLLRQVLGNAANDDYRACLAEWLATHTASISRLRRTLDEMQSSGPLDFATLSIALREVSRLR